MGEKMAPDMPVVVTLPAEIDFMNAEKACDQICAAFQPGVTVVIADLTSTAFCDSAAVRHLLLAHERAGAAEVELRFALSATGSVQRVLGLSGVDRVLAVYRTLDAAVAVRKPAVAGRKPAVAGRKPDPAGAPEGLRCPE